MTDRPIAGVIVPDVYDDATEFAEDNGVELVGECTEDEFKRRCLSKPFMPTADEAYRWMKSNPLTSADMLKEIAREAREA